VASDDKQAWYDVILSAFERDMAANAASQEQSSTQDPNKRKVITPSQISDTVTPREARKLKAVGFILAKAFYDYNQSKRQDTKLGTLVSPSKTKGESIADGKFKAGGAASLDKPSTGGPSLFDRILDTVDVVDDIRDLFSRRSRRRRYALPPRGPLPIPPRPAIPPTKPLPRTPTPPPQGTLPSKPLPRPAGAPPRPPAIPTKPLPRVPTPPSLPGPRPAFPTPRLPGKPPSIPLPRGITAAEKAAETAAKATGSISKGAKLLLRGAGTVAAGATLAIDVGTAAGKLSSEQGREELRKKAERHNIFENTGEVLKNAFLNPIETMTGITLLAKDMFGSMKDAKQSEEDYKKFAEESNKRSTDRLLKFDKDQSGKLDEFERLQMYREQKRGGMLEDRSGKKWRYSSKDDKIISSDGNVTMSVDEFLKKNSIAPTIQAPVPEQPKPAPVPPVSIANNINLDSQNSLIMAQTHILGEMLNVSKQQLATSKNMKPSNVNVGSPVNIMGGDTRNQSEPIIDPRTFYAQSPYNLIPT